MSKILYQGTELISVSGEASAIKYDNTDSGLTASDVQAAIDENVEKVETTNEKVTALEEKIDGLELTAEKVTYDDTTSQIGAITVQGAIDALKKSVSDGKSTVASAITAKGVSTASDATFQTMADNIGSIPNSNADTYTPTTNGSALDMGATNTYRYVNTNTVYNRGYNAGKSATTISSATITSSTTGTLDAGRCSDARNCGVGHYTLSAPTISVSGNVITISQYEEGYVKGYDTQDLGHGSRTITTKIRVNLG